MKNRILKLSSFLFATVALSSCLKDKGFDNNLSESLRLDAAAQKVVSIALKTDVNDNTSVVAYPALPTLTTLTLVPVTLAGGLAAAQDVHVVLQLDNTLVTDYNAANGTAFVVPATTDYAISSLSVTIPAGQSTAWLSFSLIPANFLGSTYALGFRITSVDGGYKIASNGKGVGIAAFTIQNAYEGTYLSISDRTRYNGTTVASGVLDHFYNLAPGVLKTYSTSGATAIQGGLGDSGSGVVVNLVIIAGNVVEIRPTSGVTPAEIGTNISTGSSYDPSTKTYTLHAAYHNTAGTLRTVDETIVKQ